MKFTLGFTKSPCGCSDVKFSRVSLYREYESLVYPVYNTYYTLLFLLSIKISQTLVRQKRATHVIL